MASVREIEYEDLSAVTPLFEAAGWKPPTASQWRWLWADNPAVNIDRPRPMRGWVLEGGGTIVGFMGSFPQLYYGEGRLLRAATAVLLVVLPQFRGLTLQIVSRFVRQPNVDLLLNTTASPEALRLFRFLRFEQLPQEDSDRACYWVTRPAGLLDAALRRRGVVAALRRAASLAMAPGLWIADSVQGRRPPRPSSRDGIRMDVATPNDIGPEFDELWERKRSETNKVLAVRTAEVLRHRFGGHSPAGPATLVRAWRGARLVGYAAVVSGDMAEIGLRRELVADLVVEGDDPAIAAWLLGAAFEEARRRRVHLLEVVGYSACILPLIRAGRPRVRRRGTGRLAFLYKAPDPRLQSALVAASWYATLLDGDRC